MRQELQEIKQAIYEDGDISAAEVKMLKDVFAAGFGEEEAELLLDLNHVLSGHGLAPEFADLYVDCLSGWAVDNGTLPAGRWAWIKGHILRDAVIDGIEAKLLERIRTMVSSLPADFPA